jgi:hemoglobin
MATGSPSPASADTAANITEPMIRDLVHAFYARARRDDLLGPIFEANVKDWPAHLENMCAFWSSATLRSGRYKGHPMLPHARIPEIEKAHFTRWLALFGETAGETCPRDAAALFIDRAERFGQSLQIGIAMHRKRTPAFAAAAVNANKEDI